MSYNMTYLFFLIFVTFILYDFKKGVIFYAPFKLFFYGGFDLISTAFSFDICLSFFVCFFYFIKYRNRFKAEDFPWKISYVFMTIIGIIYACNPVLKVGVLISETLCIYGYAYVLYCVLRNESDISFLLKSTALLALLLCVNGAIQFFTELNPLGDFHSSFYSDKTLFIDNNLLRFGDHIRVRSFLPHAISYGVECLIIMSLFFTSFLYFKRVYFKTYYYIILIFCLLGLIMCGSRTPLISLFIIVIPYFQHFNNASQKNKILIFSLLGGFILVFSSYFYEMYISIVEPNKSEAAGSSISMRIDQFKYASLIMQKNFWIGVGSSVNIMDMPSIDYSRLYGAESKWMILMLEKGITGVIAYIVFYLGLLVNLRNNSVKYVIIFFVFAWLVIDSATSLMGISLFLPLMVLTAFHRLGMISEKYNKSVI